MSLLMEALRQAEQSKKDPQPESPDAEHASGDSASAPLELSLQSVEEDPPANIASAGPETAKAADNSDITEEDFDRLLDALNEKGGSGATDKGLSLEPQAVPDALDFAITDEETPAEEIQEPADPVPEAAPEITSATAQPMAQDSAREAPPETAQEIQPQISNANAAARLIVNSDLRRSRSRLKLFALGLCGMVIVAVAVGMYYRMMVDQNQSYLAVTRNLERTTPVEPAPAVPPQAATPEVADTALPVRIADTATLTASATTQAEALAGTDNRPQALASGFFDVPAPRVVQPEAGTERTGIRVTRSQPDHGVQPRLQSAWQAYRAGRLDEARAIYRQVIRENPRSRDALLGLGAIATGTNDPLLARDYYLKVLDIDPHNSVANAALINMLHSSDPVQQESRVKRLLNEGGEQALLHFTLGNRYADQGRWVEAQKSYFNAYSTDPENPDFAFNLAISLDQLGQYPNALIYYRKAQALPGNRMFDPAIVEQRMQELAAAQTEAQP